MGYSSFSRVLTGWTGSLVYSDGAYTVTVTPFTRESAASLIARLVHGVLVASGQTLAVSVSSAALITLTCAVAFDLTLTSNTATRTGFTGAYTGATTYTGAIGFTSSWVPSKGMRLVDPLLATSGRGVAGDGSGGIAPVRTGATSQVIAWDAGIALPELANYEHDLWHDGRLFGRLLVTGVRRVPLSAVRTVSTVRVELDVTEVT